MIGRLAAFIYGIASYLVFFCSILYAMAFIGNYLVPKSIDVGPAGGLAQSILIDVVLLGMFAVQHSIMARPAFKRWWTTIVPASCERSTYVLSSSLLLVLIFWRWRPIKPAANPACAGCAAPPATIVGRATTRGRTS